MPKIITQEFLIILKICQTKSRAQHTVNQNLRNPMERTKKKKKRQAITDDVLLNQEEWVKGR
jgi:hypothetical protein